RQERCVALLAHVRENRRHHSLCFFELVRLASGERAGVLVLQNPDHYIMILFNGYSTIPCAPASFKRGMIVRTVDSSRMVFSAIQFSSLKWEMVGFLRAGSTASTFCRLVCSTLSSSPTLPSALIAPSSSMRISSSFLRFQASCHELRFAINC